MIKPLKLVSTICLPTPFYLPGYSHAIKTQENCQSNREQRDGEELEE